MPQTPRVWQDMGQDGCPREVEGHAQGWAGDKQDHPEHLGSLGRTAKQRGDLVQGLAAEPSAGAPRLPLVLGISWPGKAHVRRGCCVPVGSQSKRGACHDGSGVSAWFWGLGGRKGSCCCLGAELGLLHVAAQDPCSRTSVAVAPHVQSHLC